MGCRRCGKSTGGSPLCSGCAAADIDATKETPPDSGLHGATVMDAVPRPLRGGGPKVPVPPGYELDQLLGEGAMGAVYKAHHAELGRVVAIKYLSVLNPELKLRFLREGKILRDLRHPNIISLYSYDVIDEVPFLIFEFVEGRDLDVLSREAGKMSQGKASRFIDQALDGLSQAHKKRIIHRDLKPQNMLVTRENILKLADFGISSAQEAGEQWTRTGLVMGTPDYMAPEQTVSARVDHRADLYAIGCILFQLLTGSVPFEGGGGLEKLRRHREEPAPKASALEPSLSPGMVAILEKCLEKDPDRRFQSAEELREALAVRGMGQGRTTTSTRIMVAPRARWKVHAERSLLVLLVIFITGCLAWWWNRPRVVEPIAIGKLELLLENGGLRTPLVVPEGTEVRAHLEVSGKQPIELNLADDGRGRRVAQIEPAWVLEPGHMRVTAWRAGEEDYPTRTRLTLPVLGEEVRKVAARIDLDSRLIRDVMEGSSIDPSPSTTSSIQLARLASAYDVPVSAVDLRRVLSPDRSGVTDPDVQRKWLADTRRVVQEIATRVSEPVARPLELCRIMLAEPTLGPVDFEAILKLTTPLRLLDRLLVVHHLTGLRLAAVEVVDRLLSRGPGWEPSGTWVRSYNYAGQVSLLPSSGAIVASTMNLLNLGQRHGLDELTLRFAMDLEADVKPARPRAFPCMVLRTLEREVGLGPLDVIWVRMDRRFLFMLNSDMLVERSQFPDQTDIRTPRVLVHHLHPAWLEGKEHLFEVSRDLLKPFEILTPADRKRVQPTFRLNHLDLYRRREGER